MKSETVSHVLAIMNQNDGEVTKNFYQKLNGLGAAGQIATALFRAQKRSSRAKDYRRGKFRRAAYDVKSWSMSEACRLLNMHAFPMNIKWGWKEDPAVIFGERASWVLYVDLPSGQVSFHNPERGPGPDYRGEWDGCKGLSAERIALFCAEVLEGAAEQA